MGYCSFSNLLLFVNLKGEAFNIAIIVVDASTAQITEGDSDKMRGNRKYEQHR